jgi:antitoxin (DNA-binding transcriptional repressor) of toxin-antitoxin stability system
MTVTNRGKPIAMLVPPPAEGDEKVDAWKQRHTAKVVGDNVAPHDEPWEAPP